MNDQEKHQYCTNKIIKLANELREEGIDAALVSGSLMTASGVYATFIAAGNKGALEPSGVEKVVAIYRRTLEQTQLAKRAENQEKKA